MILYLPFLFQGLALFFDEFFYHHRRSLGLWERIGHPLDSVSVLICYLWLQLREPTEPNLNIYIGLVVFSCLFVTKDEFIHTKECLAGEHWLHSVLFILHPVTFMVAGFLWQKQSDNNFLRLQILLVGIFMVYQLLYWNIKWKKIPSR